MSVHMIEVNWAQVRAAIDGAFFPPDIPSHTPSLDREINCFVDIADHRRMRDIRGWLQTELDQRYVKYALFDRSVENGITIDRLTNFNFMFDCPHDRVYFMMSGIARISDTCF